MKLHKPILTIILSFVVLIGILSSISIIPEGNAGVVKRYGKATRQIDPGLNFKFPFIESVEKIEVRQRKNVEELAAATYDQLPISAIVSINWTVLKDSAMELFIQYGGLEQFESRILDPKLRSASKAALSKYPAADLIRNRQVAVATILENMTQSLDSFPIVINSPQIEDIRLPPTYKESILQKEQARENAQREAHNLERQRLESLQLVNTAEASATSKRLEADAEAYRIATIAEAEANAIQLISESLRVSIQYTDYIRAKRWNGTLPSTLVSESAGMLISPSP